MNNKKDNILVYPTLANDFVNIALSEEAKGDYNIQLFDATGKLVYSTNIKNAQKNQIVIVKRNQLLSGMYIVKVTSAFYATAINDKIIFK